MRQVGFVIAGGAPSRLLRRKDDEVVPVRHVEAGENRSRKQAAKVMRGARSK